jgi:type VI secretion system protein ImpK
MRPEMAKLVYPVFHYGLQLKERLDRGELPDLETEQLKLRGYLQSEAEARRDPEYGGGSSGDGGSSIQGVERRARDGFLGPRYALTCWLDEVFIMHSPWQREWKERSLETALYGTRDRAFRFWDQARRAEARTGDDALEVFFLCVMLGFRGDYKEEPRKLEDWLAGARTRLNRRQDTEWPAPGEDNPPINVQELVGRRRFQRAILLLAGSVLAAIFLIVVFVLKP